MIAVVYNETDVYLGIVTSKVDAAMWLLFGAMVALLLALLVSGAGGLSAVVGLIVLVLSIKTLMLEIDVMIERHFAQKELLL